jgi:hypothetical protein
MVNALYCPHIYQYINHIESLLSPLNLSESMNKIPLFELLLESKEWLYAQMQSLHPIYQLIVRTEIRTVTKRNNADYHFILSHAKETPLFD